MRQSRETGISFLNGEAFKSMGLTVNLGKTKVMVSSSITQDDMSKVDPYEVCSLTVHSTPPL